MKHLSVLLLVIFPVIFIACEKNSDEEDDDDVNITCNAASDGLFEATINNQPWTACQFKAVYYTKDRLLSVKAVDNSYKFELRFFITIDSITPLKTYTINSTSNSGLDIIESVSSGNIHGTDIYFCDLVRPGIGGTLVLSKLDTVAGLISAGFNINGYSQDQAKNITLSNGVISNVKLTKSLLSADDGSLISASINGVNWYSNQVFAKVSGYAGTPAYSYLEVRAMGYNDDLGDCPQYNQSFSRDHFWAGGRNLAFNIPLYLSAGSYLLEPSNQYSPNTPHYLFNYNHHDADDRYYPLNGSTITVTSIDTANKHLDISFTTLVRDAGGNTFNFTNGKIRLTSWLPY